jgi:hypothetical protein
LVSSGIGCNLACFHSLGNKELINERWIESVMCSDEILRDSYQFRQSGALSTPKSSRHFLTLLEVTQVNSKEQ